MKPVQTKFGQALQLAETRQQVDGLQVQVEKLKSDIKELRDKDRQIFDDQDNEIAALKALTREFIALLEDDDLVIEDCSDGWYERKRAALEQAEQLLREES